jgi:hypothetical protein
LLLFRGGGRSSPTTTHVAVAADRAYTDTNLDVAKGDTVTVQASGTVLLGTNEASRAGPDGLPNPEFHPLNIYVDGKPLEANHGSLIARVGNGRPIVIGAANTFEVTEAGRLLLGINDNGLENNSGTFDALITVDHA